MNYGGVDRSKDILARALHDMDTMGQMPFEENNQWQAEMYYDVATELQSYLAAKGARIVEVENHKECWWRMFWGRR